MLPDIYKFSLIILLLSIGSCSSNNETLLSQGSLSDQAKIINVECTGQPMNYTFNVTIESPDTGCDQYADWWEVFYPDSTLIYRRILGHSHVTEQPFTRSGGIVNVGPDAFIYVRAHMNNLGYGTPVFSGNVREGLVVDTLSVTYASLLENQSPLPDNCAF